MQNVLIGVKNLLTLANENWSLIVVVIGLGIVTYEKIRDYAQKSTDEKVDIAWDIIREKMLGFVSDAEKEWGSETGEIKRSKVIDKIFEQYPILEKAMSKEDVLVKIDELIDEALVKMREILNKDNINDVIGQVTK